MTDPLQTPEFLKAKQSILRAPLSQALDEAFAFIASTPLPTGASPDGWRGAALMIKAVAARVYDWANMPRFMRKPSSSEIGWPDFYAFDIAATEAPILAMWVAEDKLAGTPEAELRLDRVRAVLRDHFGGRVAQAVWDCLSEIEHLRSWARKTRETEGRFAEIEREYAGQIDATAARIVRIALRLIAGEAQSCGTLMKLLDHAAGLSIAVPGLTSEELPTARRHIEAQSYTCPNCSSRRVADIVYGLVTGNPAAVSKSGRPLHYAGCSVSHESRHCIACRYDFVPTTSLDQVIRDIVNLRSSKSPTP